MRAFVNWAGCVLSASRHVAVTCAHEALDRYSGPEEATVPGTGARLLAIRATTETDRKLQRWRKGGIARLRSADIRQI